MARVSIVTGVERRDAGARSKDNRVACGASRSIRARTRTMAKARTRKSNWAQEREGQRLVTFQRSFTAPTIENYK
jgi:hypothetical protein